MLPPQEKYHSYFMSDYFLSFLTHVDFLCLFHNLLFCVSAEGAREEDLDAVEAQIGCKLPDDYRCSYRIHNGQKLVVPG